MPSVQIADVICALPLLEGGQSLHSANTHVIPGGKYYTRTCHHPLIVHKLALLTAQTPSRSFRSKQVSTSV